MEFIQKSRMTFNGGEQCKKKERKVNRRTVFHFVPENADKQNAGESPRNPNNPVKALRSHQELHRELLMAHRK